MADGVEALLTPLPRDLTEGRALRVVVVREALVETGRVRLAKVHATSDPAGDGPDLVARLTSRGFNVATADTARFEDLGWGEVVESALTGRVDFAGGSLTISPTPAMTVIDVDGDAPAAPLALAAADAAAAAIRRFDLTGSIGIDFPTVGDKAVRTAIGTRLDAGLPKPFERTAVNGFGFVQIVRPRQRASLLEILRADPAATAALALVRQAERDGCGPAELVAASLVIRWLTDRVALTAELARRRGGDVGLRIDTSLPISGGYVASANLSVRALR